MNAFPIAVLLLIGFSLYAMFGLDKQDRQYKHELEMALIKSEQERALRDTFPHDSIVTIQGIQYKLCK